MPQSVWLARTNAAEGNCAESNCNNDNSCASVARCPFRFVDQHREQIRRKRDVADGDLLRRGECLGFRCLVRASRRRDFDDLGTFVLAAGVVHPRRTGRFGRRATNLGEIEQRSRRRLQLGQFGDRGGGCSG
jgi:hypothetical protein